ncbi:hypothetical protein SAMN02745687_02428 [Lachnospiraceae bacterium NK3A20]|nr:hypothetical protein SAMN02745687_02428 [Lachnospiraceae bacterium NK3A20]
MRWNEELQQNITTSDELLEYISLSAKESSGEMSSGLSQQK